jgi:hypothetical protein
LSFFISRQNERIGSNKGKKDASTILDGQAKRRDFFAGFPLANGDVTAQPKETDR